MGPGVKFSGQMIYDEQRAEKNDLADYRNTTTPIH